MNSRWSDTDADRAITRYAAIGVGADVALRVYTSRLLGADPRLVLHGGGNTSVKTEATDLLGDRVAVLCVKGSGWDMAAIEPAGHPAVRLAPLLRARALEALGDEEMVNLQRTNLLDAGAPNPSVETLLHAFLPHTFIDHTHAGAVLALTDQPDGAALAEEVFGARAALVPYIMPGFRLAKCAAEIYEANPGVEGLVLLKHGIFSFGATAREAYERMIALVSLAENRLAKGRRTLVQVQAPVSVPPRADAAPALRGALAVDLGGGAFQRWVLDFRSDSAILAYIGGEALARYSQAGVVTPDHVIRTKGWPLIVTASADGGIDAFQAAAASAVTDFAGRYRAYFQRNNAGRTPPKQALDAVPRVVLVPGLGLFGVGKSAGEAAIAADIAVSAVQTITDAEAVGRFESISEADLFDLEYWSLEQAKLGKGGEKPLARQVVLVTGPSAPPPPRPFSARAPKSCWSILTRRQRQKRRRGSAPWFWASLAT